jgi:hypothetical protein
MTIKFATATKPAPVASKQIRMVGYALGLWATGLAVAQMVSFEDFVEALRAYHVAGERGTVALAIALLALEIFAVPFLFRLSLSRAARFVSAWCAVVLPYAWTALTVNVFLNNTAVDNAGYFGGFFTFHVGAWALVLDLTWMVVVGVTFGALGGTKVIKLKA